MERRSILFWPLVGACAMCAAVSQAAARSPSAPPWPRRPGAVLYRLKSDVTDAQRAAFNAWVALHGRPHSTLSPSSVPRSRSSEATADSRFVGSEEALARSLLGTGAVAYAEPDYRMPAALLPNDPEFAQQWFDSTIDAPAAWDITQGTPTVVVAVCDTGVDAQHPDLVGRILPGYNVVDGNTDTAPVADHGTEVAGTIAAAGDNDIGVAGVAWKVGVLPVRITDNSDTTAWCSDMAAGIEWAADHGARVINLSYYTTGCPNTVESAAQYARDRGALVTVAAGNDGADLSPSYPSQHTFMLVGASDASNQRASFSNFGTPIDLVAPGVSIWTTEPNGGYSAPSGTSFSSPLVAGTAALILSVNSRLAPDQVRQVLTETARDLGAPGIDPVFGAGLLDARAALAVAQGDAPVSPQPVAITVAPTVANADRARVYPNPWRADRHARFPLTFDQLGSNSTVRLFTISGHEVRKLAGTSGAAAWDLENDAGQRVASGIYLYLITDGQGRQQTGQLAVIR